MIESGDASVDYHDRLPRSSGVHVSRPPPPAVTGTCSDPIGVLTTAFFLVTYGTRTTGAASRSTGWTAYALAVLNVVAIPLIHQGNDFLEVMVAGRAVRRVLLRRHQRRRARLPGMAIRGIRVDEPSTGRQSPPVPTTEASADLR